MKLDPLFHHGAQLEVKQPKASRGFNWPFLLLIVGAELFWIGMALLAGDGK